MDDSKAWWIVVETLFGVAYAWGVHQYTTAYPEHPYVSLEVDFGVLATVGITMLMLPDMVVPGALILVAFILTGWAQNVGEIYRNKNRAVRHASREAQRDETIDQLQRRVNELEHELMVIHAEVLDD